LICPNCNRLFTGVGGEEDVWSQYILKNNCPSCYNYHSNLSPIRPKESSTVPTLETLLITPTFLKAFNNPHIQMSWHNAYIELREAEEIIFIGYSLPDADYHFKTLMRRAIKSDTRITVVLTKNDRFQDENEINKTCYAQYRYSQYFQENSIKFYFGGEKRFFSRLYKNEKTTNFISAIKRKLNSRK